MDESIEASLAILVQFGEVLPRAMGDEKLRSDIDQMNCFLLSQSDDVIYNTQENKDKKMTTLINLYAYLSHITHYRRPWLVGSLSLRMVELAVKTGLSPMSPVAFAIFGGVLVTSGKISEGCRLGESFRSNLCLCHWTTI
jgi:hypothetical protein